MSIDRILETVLSYNFVLFQTSVLDACSQIRERLSEIKGLGHPNQYGLFLTDDDPKKGVWLEPSRTLEHYLLRDNVSIFKIYFEFPFPVLRKLTNFFDNLAGKSEISIILWKYRQLFIRSITKMRPFQRSAFLQRQCFRFRKKALSEKHFKCIGSRSEILTYSILYRNHKCEIR